MINKYFVVAVSSLLTGGIGSAASYFITRRVYKKRMDDAVKSMDEYTESCTKYANEMRKYAEDMYELYYGKEPPKDLSLSKMVDFLKKKKKESSKIDEEKKSDSIVVDNDDDLSKLKGRSTIDDIVEKYNDEKEKENDDAIEQYVKSHQKTDYTQYAKNAHKYDSPEEVGVPVIELITEWEFDNDCVTYDKERLNYYEDDDVVTDSEDRIMDNPEEYIGTEALLSFGSPDEENPNFIHVRNNRRFVDYEIERVSDSYTHYVLGIAD